MDDVELMDLDGPEFINEVNLQIASIRSAGHSMPGKLWHVSDPLFHVTDVSLSLDQNDVRSLYYRQVDATVIDQGSTVHQSIVRKLIWTTHI